MARLVHRGIREWQTREIAAAVAQQAEYTDGDGQICALREWAGAHFYFLRDARGVEQLHGVELMLNKIASDGAFAGDCDDAAILLGALCGVIGCAVRFQAVSFLDNPSVFVHVWAEAQAPQGTGDWYELDITRPFQRVPMESLANLFTFPVLQ
jgi:hypothetical protein